MRRLAALMLIVVAPLAAPLAAQAHPDFSGRWTLDTTQLSPEMAGVSGTVTIVQTDRTVRMDQNISSPMAGAQQATLNFNLDGTASKNSVPGPGMTIEITSTAVWEGSMLVITSTGEFQGNSLKTVQHWSLDPTGKVLTLASDVSAGGQSMSRKQVFKKS